MKLFSIFVLWSSIIFANVYANNDSISYELIYFYYVYKLEWNSGVTRSIAVGCSETYGRMCYFDEFAKYLIEQRWLLTYKPTAADHTITPDESQVTKLKVNIPASARYNLKRLMATFTEPVSMNSVLERVLGAANTALTANADVDQDDIKEASTMIKSSMTVRNAAVYEVIFDNVSKFVAPGAVEYLSTVLQEFDWEDTLDNIDTAVADGKIPENAGYAYKANYLEFSENIDAYLETSDVTHLNVIRGMSTTIDEINGYLDESSSDGLSFRAASSCSSDNIEFGESSESE